VTKEEEAFEAEADVVATDGGSRNHGYYFEPNITLGSCTDKCTPHRRHGGTTLAIGQGRRVCLQHPDDETRTKDKCIPLGDGGTNVLVFSDQDACGCCGGECPRKCTACVCSDVDRDGTKFTGLWMSVPRHGHHLWGVPVTSVFAPKTLLATCSYAEEAATTTSQPVAPLVTTTITSKNKYQCHEKAMQMTPPPKKRKRGRAQNESKPKGETYLFCFSGGMIQPKEWRCA
jgi:hypothetical protein